jgi:hypothetical protein
VRFPKGNALGKQSSVCAFPEGKRFSKQSSVFAFVKTNALIGHHCYLVPVRKWLFSPISLLDEKNYPRNIKYMPAVIFFVRLDLEKNSSFLDRHYLGDESPSPHAWPVGG